MTKADYAGKFKREVTKTGRCTLWRPHLPECEDDEEALCPECDTELYLGHDHECSQTMDAPIRCAPGCPATECSGPLHSAHWIGKSWLLARFGDDDAGWKIAYDPRCARPLCDHHHTLSHHSPTFRFYREDIPSTCWEWAREHDLEWRLVRDYAPLEDALEIA